MNSPNNAQQYGERLWRRRSVLKASGAAAVGLLSGATVRPSRAATESRTEKGGTPSGSAGGRARNVIFMVSDGMSAGTLTLADVQLKRTTGKASRWVSMWNQPGVRRASATTYCADSLVTDSAAGGSAWGCGRHVKLGVINVADDGTQLMPILIRAKQVGKAVGCVSTARITHATPASFYANNPRRDLEAAIAEQLVRRRIDVALGGGGAFFPPATLAINPNLTVVRTAAELRGLVTGAQAMPGPVLGLFAEQHVPFELDRPATVPTLAQMTTAALDRLGRAPDGFVLQVEGGRVDHAAHANDAAALVSEQIEFDKAIGVVLEWIKDRDDTLLILTTDHGTANPGLTIYLESGADGMDRLTRAKHSFEWLGDRLEDLKANNAAMTTALPEIVHRATGLELDAADVQMLLSILNEQRVEPFQVANKWTSVLGGVLENYFGVGFISPNHSADMVEVTVMGPGSERMPALIDNIDLHAMMAAALALPEGTLLDDMHEHLDVATRPKMD